MSTLQVDNTPPSGGYFFAGSRTRTDIIGHRNSPVLTLLAARDCFALNYARMLAQGGRVELPLTVLETVVLPIKLAPHVAAPKGGYRVLQI